MCGQNYGTNHSWSLIAILP